MISFFKVAHTLFKKNYILFYITLGLGKKVCLYVLNVGTDRLKPLCYAEGVEPERSIPLFPLRPSTGELIQYSAQMILCYIPL